MPMQFSKLMTSAYLGWVRISVFSTSPQILSPFAPEMTNDYQNSTVEIYVLAQAVQSDNNGYDPLMALGWSEPAKELIQNAEENAE